MEHPNSSVKTMSGETRQKCLVRLEWESPSERSRHQKMENAPTCKDIIFLQLFFNSRSLKPHCRLCQNAAPPKTHIFQESAEDGILRGQSGSGPSAVRVFDTGKVSLQKSRIRKSASWPRVLRKVWLALEDFPADAYKPPCENHFFA